MLSIVHFVSRLAAHPGCLPVGSPCAVNQHHTLCGQDPAGLPVSAHISHCSCSVPDTVRRTWPTELNLRSRWRSLSQGPTAAAPGAQAWPRPFPQSLLGGSCLACLAQAASWESRPLELGLQRPSCPSSWDESPTPLISAPGWVPSPRTRHAEPPCCSQPRESCPRPERLLFSHHPPWALPASGLCSVRGRG